MRKMGTRRIKVKTFKLDAQGRIKWTPIDVNHPFLSGPGIASNAHTPPWPVQNLTFTALQQALNKLQNLTADPALESAKLTKEEMAQQVELYKNVIETKFGVKLCVSHNMDSDMISMLLLVPNKLFADDGGRESLADALHNIAMFIMNMDDPSL
jgi:hypothetical protein